MCKISILMSTYNEPNVLIEEAVKSILIQSFREFEFIILLDNPQNISIKKLLLEFAEKDKRIKVIINDSNMGLVGSLNRGLSYCQGEYIVRMDADDISCPNRIEKQLGFINQGYDIVGAWYELFFTDKDQRKIIKFPNTHEECLQALKNNNCVPHPLWMVRKSVYNKLGGYRDIYACEDYDFIIRAVKNGFKVGNCPEVLLHYRFNANSISRKNAVEQKVIADFLAYNFRNGRSVELLEYKNYKESKEFNDKYGKLMRINKKILNFKHARSTKEKLVGAIALVLEPKYIGQKLKIIK
ncbi:MAG: glycosyltransferase [Lachnospiraceae bacterium]|nr:glycosyltransferase [Lachnospiraceae bacterium]